MDNGGPRDGRRQSNYGAISSPASTDVTIDVEDEQEESPDTPLLGTDLSGLPGGDSGTCLSSSTNTTIPDEPLKTVLSGLFLGGGFLFTTFSLALTHESVPDYPPLPDMVLDNVSYQSWGLDVSEYIILVMMVLAFTLVMVHAHRMVVLRRVCLVMGMMYYYRGITMFITVLPKPDVNYMCAPKLNHTITFLELLQRVVKISSGGGLTINGQQVYCGDFIFSGHTMVLLMGFFVIREYSPRQLYVLHWFSLALAAAGIVFLLIARGHYSIDVLIAYWVTSRLWWSYHTLAHTSCLKVIGDHNYASNMWWWYAFRYFESEIPGRLPRRYSLPLPSSFKLWARRKWEVRRSASSRAE